MCIKFALNSFDEKKWDKAFEKEYKTSIADFKDLTECDLKSVGKDVLYNINVINVFSTIFSMLEDNILPILAWGRIFVKRFGKSKRPKMKCPL